MNCCIISDHVGIARVLCLFVWFSMSQTRYRDVENWSLSSPSSASTSLMYSGGEAAIDAALKKARPRPLKRKVRQDVDSRDALLGYIIENLVTKRFKKHAGELFTACKNRKGKWIINTVVLKRQICFYVAKMGRGFHVWAVNRKCLNQDFLRG